MIQRFFKKSLFVLLYTALLGSAMFIFCIGLLHLITGNFFVLHDNANNSSDQIIHGLVKLELLTYTTLLIIGTYSRFVVPIKRPRKETRIFIAGFIICVILIPSLFRYFVPALMILSVFLVFIFYYSKVDEEVTYALFKEDTI
jgi:hypothetical protein